MTEQLALQYDDLDAHEARVLCILRAHCGRAAAIGVEELAAIVGISGRKVQEIVHRLRLEHGQPIASAAANPNGYFIPETPGEIDGFYREQKAKALGTLAAAAAVKRVGLPELLGQLAIEVAS